MTQPALTEQQLAEIEARHTAATPGPWGVYEFGGGSAIDIAAALEDTGTGYRARREICRLEDEPLDNDPTHREWTAEEDWAQVRADAAFIAHAPGDVAALLAEIRRLRDELAATRTKVIATEADEIVAHCPDHGSRDGVWITCHCDVADDMRRRTLAAPAV